MSKANYSEELKEHILSEHAPSESISSLARKYEPSVTAIRNWKRQAKLKASGAESSESKDQQLRRLRRQNEQLRQENAFLKSGRLVRRQRRDRAWWKQAYQLIEMERKHFTIRLICRVLEISESGYYAWRKRKPSPRRRDNEKLLAEICSIWIDSRFTGTNLII